MKVVFALVMTFLMSASAVAVLSAIKIYNQASGLVEITVNLPLR